MASHPHRLLNLLEEHAWVCELINCDRGEWKAEVVKSLFIPHEAETILGIPISSALLEDSVIWYATPNGKFSVRSTYELAMNLCEQSERGCISNDGVIKKFWRKIWSLQVPNKWVGQYIAEFRFANEKFSLVNETCSLCMGSTYCSFVDAAIFSSQRTRGVGTVIRDEIGLVVGALTPSKTTDNKSTWLDQNVYSVW
uniref:Uncharacterized protein n=1 Tax=Quercus lobata TaxID=97700 RepID=A0A7N2KJT8_QUELO